jgi:hypothetical protein
MLAMDYRKRLNGILTMNNYKNIFGYHAEIFLSPKQNYKKIHGLYKNELGS